jgi:S-adenosylmethionine hydrolase
VTVPTTGSERTWVTFLSDYGLDDHLVGVCKGVIARIAPAVRVIDVCHQVRAQDVGIGATMLAEALPYLPVGVHLALVDPFRRTHVRGVAVRCSDGSVIICPDNGLGPSAAVTFSRRLPRTWPPASRSPRSAPRSSRPR